MPKDKYITGFEWLAIYQIIGGLLGLLFMTRFIWFVTLLDIGYDVLVFAGVLLYLFSIYCGIILLQSKSNSLILSIFCQSFQAVSVSLFGFAYKYVSGFLFSIVLESSDTFHVRFGFSLSSFSFVIGTDADDRRFEFNIVAMLIIMVLFHAIKSVNLEKRGDLVDSIGN